MEVRGIIRRLATARIATQATVDRISYVETHVHAGDWARADAEMSLLMEHFRELLRDAGYGGQRAELSQAHREIERRAGEAAEPAEIIDEPVIGPNGTRVRRLGRDR